jgi:FkbM family methyltransferase
VKVLNLSELSSVDNFPRSTLSGFLADDPDAQLSYWYGPFDRDTDKRIEEARIVLDLITGGSLPVGDTPLMVDVGACKGSAFGEFAAQNWTVHAFEPNPPVFEVLLGKFSAPNVTINRLAVSDMAGEDLPFYTSEESLGISSLKPFRPTHEETARVKTVTLDTYLDENSIDRIDFLKIDTEGFDLMVLKGLDLNRHDVETILCEFEDRKTQPLGYSMPDMADYLEQFGYTLYVSEWHPVVRYGGPHQWRALKRYRCELEAPDAWGNLFAFKSDPGIWALTEAVNRSVKRFVDKKKDTQEPHKEAQTSKTMREPHLKAARTRRYGGINGDQASKASTLEAKLAATKHRIQDLELQLSQVFGSTSWRITAPLRLAKSAGNRVFRRK